MLPEDTGRLLQSNLLLLLDLVYLEFDHRDRILLSGWRQPLSFLTLPSSVVVPRRLPVQSYLVQFLFLRTNSDYGAGTRACHVVSFLPLVAVGARSWHCGLPQMLPGTFLFFLIRALGP